jgi:hypothetical protein
LGPHRIICSLEQSKSFPTPCRFCGGFLLNASREIIARNQALLDSIPPQLRYNHDQSIANAPLQAFKAAQEYLGIIHNEFMVQRTLCRHMRNGTAELLRISQRMLSVVLDVSNVRSPLPGIGRYVPWMNIFFGLPPAGVLAIELLQHKRHPASSETFFPKGRIIQDLSVFVSNLRWMYVQGDGNYQLADQARHSLQKILDTFLDDVPSSASASALPNTGIYLDQPNQPLDSLMWLANSDFDTEFWTNLPGNLALS